MAALVVVHAETEQMASSSLSASSIAAMVDAFIAAKRPRLECVQPSLTLSSFEDEKLRRHVRRVSLEVDPRCVGDPRLAQGVDVGDKEQVQVAHHVYRLHTQGGEVEEMETSEESDPVEAATQWSLPNACFDGLWESLVFESSVKDELLTYGHTALTLSSSRVDPKLVSWNKLILLHGPPGTGKTSLCQALANKLSIRQGFKCCQLIEINAHSLFSKWFSESGKLVQRMFATVLDLVEDSSTFVVLLIDEIESLAAARKASSSEPSDAIRVVNALLTQLDNLKRQPNILVLATSNLSDAIDEAFVDRADLKRYIGPPSAQTIVAMLEQSCKELALKKLLTLPNDAKRDDANNAKNVTAFFASSSSRLLLEELAKKCEGLSGRAVRRLPFLALTKVSHAGLVVDFPTFMLCMEKAISMAKDEK